MPADTVAVSRSRWQRATPALKAVAVMAVLALTIQLGMLLVALFAPPLPYRISKPAGLNAESEEFIQTLAALTGATVHRGNAVEVFTNGDKFYEAELKAISGAKSFVHMERYIFNKGEIAKRYLDALADRARNGVRVRVVLDAIGTHRTPDSMFKPLRDAGGRVAYYRPVRWYTWPRVNYRTHRELLVVDGRVGFSGGAGVGDFWDHSIDGQPQWRDMMLRFEGQAAAGLQEVFVENWLESSGEVLMSPEYFASHPGPGNTLAMVVASSPTTGRSTEARVLVQSLLATADSRVRIESPYFLPDESLTREIAKAIRERRVDVKIIVPGEHNDHKLIRAASRRLYGPLLEAGAEIYEYQPGMIHVKSLVVDTRWSVVGSTNMDARSFSLNDEVSVVMLDRAVAARLEHDFDQDLAKSRRVTLRDWQHRPFLERGLETFGSFLEQQQ